MDFMNLSIFSELKTKMHWHQTRQGVLAQNIANAATPDYVAKDLAPLSKSQLKKAPGSSASFGTFLTNAKHIGASIAPPSRFDGARPTDSFEITPDENTVVLEDQMAKVADNQMAYQSATSLYSSNLGLIRTAMGGGNR